jgi:hypothetical protein
MSVVRFVRLVPLLTALGVVACSGPNSDDSNDTDDTGAGADSDSGSADAPTTTSPGGTDDATTDPSVDGSGGDDSSGGPLPPGVACDSQFDHEGRVGCLSEVGGLEVKFFPLAEGTRVQRLVIFFHGDTGADWFDNWGFRPEILDWAQPQDMLVLGVKAPSSYRGDTEPSYGAAQPDHAEVVAQAIEYFADQYEVPADRSLYWGVSGGSWFFTSSFIAVAGQRLPGIFAANCGGSGFSFGWTWDPQTDVATRDLNALLLNYGELDFLAENSAASYAEYMGMGFVTEQIVVPGATHCDHPIAEPTIEFWESQLP